MAEENAAAVEVEEMGFDEAFNEGNDEVNDQQEAEQEGKLADDGTEDLDDQGSEDDPASNDQADDKTPAEGEAAAAAEPQEPEQVAALKKQIEDNKAFATRVAQENARLRDELKAKDKPAAKDEPEELTAEEQEYLLDYPEAEKVINRLVAQGVKQALGGADLGQLGQIPTLRMELEQSRFNNAVIGGTHGPDGEWVDGHPDTFKVMRSPEFATYLQEKRQADPAFDIADPVETIKFIGSFKAATAKAAQAASVANKAAQRAADKAALAGGITTGSGSGLPAGAKTNQSFDEAFDED